jgi:hypothetical protein
MFRLLERPCEILHVLDSLLHVELTVMSKVDLSFKLALFLVVKGIQVARCASAWARN